MRTTQGYSLVELLIAIAVSSIVISGTYAGYMFFAQQQQVLMSQTEVDRNAMRVIDLFESDIRMAGYKDFFDTNAMLSTQPIVINAANPGDIRFVYDDYDNSGTLFRGLVRYYLNPYPMASGGTRNRLFREWRKCNNPALFCDLSNSTPITGSTIGEPVLDWVSNFTVQGLNPKPSGTFANQFQTVQVNLGIQSPQKIEGTTRVVSKSFTFLARAKNVSLVP